VCPGGALRITGHLILYDIKHMDSAKHRAGTGKSNGSILRNARIAASLDVEMVACVPVIPGFNDSPDEIVAIGRFARDIGLSELHLLPYHRYGVPSYSNLGGTYALTETASPSESDSSRSAAHCWVASPSRIRWCWARTIRRISIVTPTS
jgi:pyruvate-formate lyase-activating enzyme